MRAVLLALIFTFTALPRNEPYELKYPANFGSRFTIPADNPITKEGVALGRMLFYEERLSSNNTRSCASCHKQEFAFTDNQRFSFGADGTPTNRNSMSLANVLWVNKFFWDGRTEGLEQQAIVPMTDPHEMNQSLGTSSKKLTQTKVYPALFEKAFGSREINGDRITKAISQFERTLISANSKYDQYLNKEYKLTESEQRGLVVFDTKGNCAHCHGGPKTFIELFHNNGLDSVQGRFRVPTLRNISVTAPYMHDGRFKDLSEVLNHYGGHIIESENVSPFLSRLSLTEDEKKDVISFLNTLTDTEFINNKNFSDPDL
ncbi:MAG: cytochrome c peroxidase [Bacteroidota bacterium]